MTSRFSRVSRVVLLVSIAFAGACSDSTTTPGTLLVGRDTVGIMTYNIFHDGENAGQGILPWSERSGDVVGTILDTSPDVLALQEAEAWQVDWLLDELRDYAAVARGIYANPDVEGAETVAIFYRTDRFVARDSGHFWHSDSPDIPGSYGTAEFGGMRSPHMTTWVRLGPVGAPESAGFYVFNTHFVADGTATDAALGRSRSAELMVQRVADRSYPEEYFFVVGDLNTSPGEWPLLYLFGSRCDTMPGCTGPSPSPAVRMIDAWASRHEGEDAGSRCNAVTGRDGVRVDYVLVWDPTPPGPFCDPDSGLCEGASILSAEIVRGRPGCPSDHRPVAATLVLPRLPLPD